MVLIKKRITAIEDAVTFHLSPLERGLLMFIRDEIDRDFTPEREGQCYGIWIKTVTDDDKQDSYKKWVDAGNECPFKPYPGVVGRAVNF